MLIEASIADISGLIPNFTTDAASHEIGDLIFEGLVSLDGNLEPFGQLAESWATSEDCRSVTFKLKRGVKWHDGHPFTADDVLFTYHTMIDPSTPTAYKANFQNIVRAQAIDSHTVRLEYSKPTPNALLNWTMWILPKHLLAGPVAKDMLREAPLAHQPVGTGPYRFLDWKSGDRVMLTANPDYHEGRPHLDRIMYRIIPSQSTIFLELKAKGVDLANLSAMQYARQTSSRAFNVAYGKYRYPSDRYTYLGFNLKDPRFADRRVRRAFAHAIDKRELIDGPLMGLAHVATGPLRPGTWAYTGDVHQYAFDPNRARALLAEAGWRDRNGDGIVEDKSGKPFAFVIRTNQGNDDRRKVAQIIQQRLKDVGVATDIQVIEWSSLLTEFIGKGRFEAVLMGWGVGVDPDQYDVWHSSQTGPGQLNRISYANPEIDAALERGRDSCDRKERIRHYHRFQEILAEDQPVIFLYFQDALPVVASRIRGVKPALAGILYNLTDWYVPRSFQRYSFD